jgi:hypothetical protein
MAWEDLLWADLTLEALGMLKEQAPTELLRPRHCADTEDAGSQFAENHPIGAGLARDPWRRGFQLVNMPIVDSGMSLRISGIGNCLIDQKILGGFHALVQGVDADAGSAAPRKRRAGSGASRSQCPGAPPDQRCPY